MNPLLNHIIKNVYEKCNFEISEFLNESESKEYDACRFLLNDKKIIYRSGKITPKKLGHFVTFWKRNELGATMPFEAKDDFDFFIINAKKGDQHGQFIFPKTVLIKKAIISTPEKEGKRGFRVYPNWDQTQSKQAVKTQEWQSEYFFEMDKGKDSTGLVKFMEKQGKN